MGLKAQLLFQGQEHRESIGGSDQLSGGIKEQEFASWAELGSSKHRPTHVDHT